MTAAARRLPARLGSRLAWSGPLLTRPGQREHRVAMARSAVYLYAAGGTLVLASLLLPGADGRWTAGIAAVGVLGFAGALYHLLVFDRLPVWGFHLSSLIGVVLVSIASDFAGDAGPAYRLIYVWIILFGFFFYRPLEALLQLVLVGAAWTLMFVLDGRDAALAPVLALLVVGALAIAGSLVLVAKRRVHALLDDVGSSERRYRTLVEELPLVTYVDRVDAVSSNVYRSPQIEALLGYPPEQWTEEPDLFARVVHPDDRERVLAEHARVHETGEPLQIEYRLVARDGRVVPFADTAVIVRDDKGRPLYLQGFLVDLTAQKELEGQLRQSQKMDALGQLAGGVALDFNNLLTAIGGYVELALVRAGGDDPELTRQLGEIRNATARASTLTQRLLAFSRRQVHQPRVLDLNEVVEELRPMLRLIVGDDVVLRVEPGDGLGHVLADRAQLEQALVNLALNARDAIDGAGTITIATANVELGRQGASEHGLEPGPYVALSVADTGGGMDEETRSRALEPFFTTKPPGKGTGLGLSTVYGVVTKSRGAIALTSAPGLGTTFTILLPGTDEAPERRASPASEESPGGRGTILLVEDELVVRALVRELLEEQGYDVVEAAGPEEALGAVDGGLRPELLLTDVVMPGMDGPELAERIAAVQPELPVLFMSGYPGQGNGGLGDRPLLRKPFAGVELARAVAGVLEQPRAA